MSASAPNSHFSQWLLAASNANRKLFSLVIHGEPDCANDALVDEITCYLNEYDGDADGLWLSATHELMDVLADDPSHLHWLGVSAEQDTYRALEDWLLPALKKFGQLVCAEQTLPTSPSDMEYTFHVRITRDGDGPTPCHMSLNPDLIQRDQLPQIIADVFLEWLQSQVSRQSMRAFS